MAINKTEYWIQHTLKDCAATQTSFEVGPEMIGIILSALTETAFEYSFSPTELEMFRCDLGLALTEFTRKSVNPVRRWMGSLIKERREAKRAADNLRSMIRHIMAVYRMKKEGEHVEGTMIQLVMESDDAFPTDLEKTAQLMEVSERIVLLMQKAVWYILAL